MCGRMPVPEQWGESAKWLRARVTGACAIATFGFWFNIMRRELPSVWSSLCITNVVLNSERYSTTCAVSEEHLLTSPSNCAAPAPVPLPSAVSRTAPHKLGTPAHAGPHALTAPSSTTAGGSGSKGQGHGGGGGGTRRCTHCMAMGTTGGFWGGFEAQHVVLWAQEVVGHPLCFSAAHAGPLPLVPTQPQFLLWKLGNSFRRGRSLWSRRTAGWQREQR